MVHVSFVSVDAARDCVQRLDGYNFEGSALRVERLMDRRQRTPRGAMAPIGGSITSSRGAMGLPSSSPVSQRHTEFPLRILVLSEMVGAIIGRQGATIRAITQQVSSNFKILS